MKSNKYARLDQLKAQLRPHLADYVARHRRYIPGKNFNCLNPAHPDRDPSCGIIPGNPELFHCFGCDSAGDIFTAAHMLEGRPVKGPGFLVENLFYLAQMFGLEIPQIEMSDEELFDLDTYRAYSQAAHLIVTAKKSDMVSAKLNDYGWSEKTLGMLGIGSVESYESYLRQMVQSYGFSLDFLKQIDLDNKAIFNPDHLIFTVKDEHGQPVGFASRNLHYDGWAEAFSMAVEQFGRGSAEAARAREAVPPKFVNTSAANRLYQKGRRLFGLDLARKHAPPLWIFEGYGDGATARDAGLHNASAIGATQFTGEHLEVILSLGIEHIIFVLDADRAGAKGTEKFVRIVEEHLGNHVGLKTEIVIMPPGSDDPDAFIRANGLDEFLNLERLDIFSWRLRHAIDNGEDPDKVFEATIGLILNEPHNLKRVRMADALSKAIPDIPRDVIWAEVVRRTDAEGQRIQSELAAVAEKTRRLLERSPAQVYEILLDSQKTVERINTQRYGYDLNTLVGYVDSVFEEAENTFTDHGLLTGWPIFDRMFGGIPESDSFISIPGKPNSGKSSWLCNLAQKLVDHNDDLIVLYHTVDDAASWFIPRILGSKYRIPSSYFRKAGFHVRNKTMVRPNGGPPVEFGDVHREAKRWFREKMLAEKLLVHDISMMDESIVTLERRVKDLRKKYTSLPIVVFGDNFHLYNNPAVSEEGERLTRSMSKACKAIANKQHCSIIMTMELPKTALEEGMRPRLMNIKGSAGISYDASANIGIYNDLKDRRDQATLTWEESCSPTEVEPGQVVTKIRMPVLELVFDKSKVNNGFDGNIYFRFHGASGHVEECSQAEQEIYRRRSYSAQMALKQDKKGKNGARPAANGTAEYAYEYTNAAVAPQMQAAEHAPVMAGGGFSDESDF